MSGVFNVFNSLTRQLEPFRPRKGRTVRMYACGPTVYDFAHIGNLRMYTFEDVLKRVLILNDYRVRHVMNITDVGHLTDDADQGEDKLERAAMRQQKSAKQLAVFYTRAFLKDLKRLNVLPADEMPKATQYIPEQIALVRRLERRGYTYTTSDGVYFDTVKFPAYGQAFTSQFEISNLKSRAGEGEAHSRISVNPEKRSPHDFALWKISPEYVAASLSSPRGGLKAAATPISKRQMEWDSPWGRGFPGWHLECSVMARELLGQPFDIHCGGIDHIPVHHTNEIAQSEAAHGKPLANFWLHGAFLTVDGKRMGKSEGNLVTVDQLIARGFDPLAYRYLVLGAHYRSMLNFTWESLAGAQSALERLREICRALPALKRESGMKNLEPGTIERMRAAFNDDLDTPKALALLWDMVKSGTPPVEQSQALTAADRVFGLGLERYLGKPLRIPTEVQRLVTDREDARVRKDWARADVLRAQIEAFGWIVEDTKGGPVVKKA